MKLTILQVGETPAPLRDRYERYPPLFQNMFAAANAGFTYEEVFVLDGDPFPDPRGLEGIVLTGSAAGVYDDTPWMNPLRQFIRGAYAVRTPMLGVCFGHQIMADALGGGVRKSDKGWGIGRHSYVFENRPGYFGHLGESVAIAASHQDQVIVPPAEAETFMASEFTPHAGLIYKNGAAISLQSHPEFDHAFAEGLIELRRDNPLPDDIVDRLKEEMTGPLDSPGIAKGLAQFLKQARP